MKFLILCSFVVLTACSLQKIEPTHDYDYFKDVPYKTIDGVTLSGDLYIPKELTANAPKTLKPAVLVVHGGSWSARFGDMQSISRDLAHAGFVAYNITYRLAPKYLYPRAIDDVTSALQWLYDNAEKYGIDRNRISGWGYSAGSHLVLMAGLNPNHHMHSIVAGGTPANLTVWPKSPLVTRFIGKTYAEAKSTWEEASPVNHVESQSPPVFLYHGENDDLVEINQMYMMRDALKNKGRKVETYTVPYWGHPGAYVFSQTAVKKGIQFLRTN